MRIYVLAQLITQGNGIAIAYLNNLAIKRDFTMAEVVLDKRVRVAA